MKTSAAVDAHFLSSVAAVYDRRIIRPTLIERRYRRRYLSRLRNFLFVVYHLCRRAGHFHLIVDLLNLRGLLLQLGGELFNLLLLFA